MTNLHNANIGFNKYCGPAVLSILTGENSDYCAGILQGITGESKIKGVYFNDLLRALDKLGYDQIHVEPDGSTLFRNLFKLRKLNNGNGIYIIQVEDHFVIIESNEGKVYLCDNHTKSPINAASSARLQQKVLKICKVEKRKEKIISKYIGPDYSVRNDSVGVISFYQINRHEDWCDDTEAKLGSFRYQTSEELANISMAFAKLMGSILKPEDYK